MNLPQVRTLFSFSKHWFFIGPPANYDFIKKCLSSSQNTEVGIISSFDFEMEICRSLGVIYYWLVLVSYCGKRYCNWKKNKGRKY
jgi:hypothetical protein